MLHSDGKWYFLNFILELDPNSAGGVLIPFCVIIAETGRLNRTSVSALKYDSLDVSSRGGKLYDPE